MGIFTGTELLFYFLGALTALMVTGLVWLRRRYVIRWYGNLVAGTGTFLLIFTLAWSVSSIMEGEPQAANMGLLIFGIPALLLLATTRRLMTPRAAR